ncbi:MAG: DUF4158 domain-containing protein, partial [Rubrobacter sp.]|nr:DUF4158 domain-containing protein [Rubrobacter sp.]
MELARSVTRGGDNELAFLVLLKSFQRLGYFPTLAEVPEPVVLHVRSCLGVGSDAQVVPPRRSRQRYRDAIRGHLGVRAFGNAARHVAAQAVAEAARTMDEPADLINVSIEELIKERFELPVFATLDRLARHARHAVNSRLFAGIDERLADSTRHLLDSLLEPGTSRRSDLNTLKAVPRSATRKNLKELQERLLWLELLADTSLLLEGIPNQKIANLAAQARALDASELKKVSGQRRKAMLVCLIHRAKVGVRDSLAEMMVKIMGKVHKSGREELESLHREKRATTEHLIELLEKILAGAHQLEGDDAALGKEVRRVLADGGGTEALLEAALSLSAHRGGNYLPLLWKFYKNQRATLFRVLASLEIRPTTEDRSLADALEFVLDNQHRRG